MQCSEKLFNFTQIPNSFFTLLLVARSRLLTFSNLLTTYTKMTNFIGKLVDMDAIPGDELGAYQTALYK